VDLSLGFYKAEEIFRSHFRTDIAPFEEASGKVALFLMQSDYFFLNGVLADQPIDGNRSGLADSMGSVGSLIFDGRIPPRVHMNDIIRGG
jgi:hypothetical protein